MPSTRDLTIYFDLTTSLSWGGAPVGITRVEREIARRAKGRTRFEVRYCFFHQATNAYFELQPAFAEKVLAGEAWVDLNVVRSLQLHDFESAASELDDPIVHVTPVRSLIALRHQVQGLSLADVLEYRDKNPMIAIIYNNKRLLVALPQIVNDRIKLSKDVIIINGGLDWEHKNIRNIRNLKLVTDFTYVAILYDVIPLIYPHFLVTYYVDLLKKYFGELFWTADCLMCISETTRKDVENYLSSWRMPIPHMVDWPLGSDIEASACLKGGAVSLPAALREKPFLLYVSTIEPRKSHRTIVEAFERGIASGVISTDAVCVFVGRVGWNSENLLHEIRSNPLLSDRIVILSGISDEELMELYRAARFVVFPSRYEGYGLSLVEAMALGKACISGPAGSLREVGGEAPLYIDPFDQPQWARALEKAFADDAMIAELEHRSRTFYQKVSWDDSADLFYGALDRWLGERA